MYYFIATTKIDNLIFRLFAFFFLHFFELFLNRKLFTIPPSNNPAKPENKIAFYLNYRTHLGYFYLFCKMTQFCVETVSYLPSK